MSPRLALLLALALLMPPRLEAQTQDQQLRAAQTQVFQDALRRVTPSVVRIDTVGGAQPAQADDPSAFRQADGPTTGVIWDADGWILTSSFNFIRNPLIITVTMADGRRFVAQVVAQDSLARLALLRIDATGLPTLPVLQRSELRSGQWALAAGFGHGGDAPAITLGAVSSTSRMAEIAVQTDAKISPANYGGPLFDIEGRLLGVCVPLAPSEDELAGVEWYDSGIGFAIHADYIAEKIDRLKGGESLQRGLLGIVFDNREPVESWSLDEPPGLDETASEASQSAPTTAATSSAPAAPAPASAASRPARPPGLVIARPPVGPAAQSGLRMGDVVTRVDDREVLRGRDFRAALARRSAGDEVQVTYWRAGEASRVAVQTVTREQLRAATSQPR